MKIIYRSLFPSLTVIFISACSGSTEEKVPVQGDPLASTSGEATLNLVFSKGGIGTLILDNAVTCFVDPDSSDLRMHITDANYLEALFVDIVSLYSSERTYTCAQATTNTAFESLGDGFDGCAVEVRTISDESVSLNAFEMYRDSLPSPAFTYSDSCSISITDTEPQVEGSLDCSKIPQTILNGTFRNPVDTSITVDVSGKFSCETDLL